MNKILNWLKSLKNNERTYIKPQKLVDLKRSSCTVTFITPKHPLYENIAQKEENKLHILAPNETAYNETSLIHNFAAIVTYNDNQYLIINSFKHFKEQSIGGLLQFDENIYNVIPFIELEDEYKTAQNTSFHETYEYDHPVESYAFIVETGLSATKLTLERAKKPLTALMVDKERPLFSEKLTKEQIELLDYVVIPALNAYNEIQNRRKHIAS